MLTRQAEKKCIRRGFFAHCDAALNLMVFVDHGGKLFERLKTNELDGCGK